MTRTTNKSGSDLPPHQTTPGIAMVFCLLTMVGLWAALVVDAPLVLTCALAAVGPVLCYRGASSLASARRWMLALIPLSLLCAGASHFAALVSEASLFAFVGCAVLGVATFVGDVVFSMHWKPPMWWRGRLQAAWRNALTNGRLIDDTDPQLQHAVFASVTAMTWSAADGGYLLVHYAYGMLDHALLQSMTIGLAMWALVYLRHTGRLGFTSQVMVFLGAANFLFFLYTGGIDKTGNIWIPLFPFLTYLIAPSATVALAWIVGVGAAILALAAGQHAGMLQTPYSPVELLVCLSAYCVFAICASMYDSMRGRGFLSFVKRMGALQSLLMTHVQESELRQSIQKEFDWDRTHDEPTQLLNRVGLLAYLQEQAQQRSIAVIHLRIPDIANAATRSPAHNTHRVARHIAERLKQLPIPAHCIARCSPNGFSVGFVFMQMPSVALVDGVAQRVIELFSVPLRIQDEDLALPVVVGVAFRAPSESTTVEDVYRQALTATLTEAAQAPDGYQHIHYFDASAPYQTGKSHVLRDTLLSMVERDAFYLVFQPQIDPTRNTLEAAIATLRWDLGPHTMALEASQLLPVARTLGLSTVFANLLLHKACQRIQAWSSSEVDSLPIVIALSVQDLEEPAFIAALDNAIGGAGISPKLLRIEVPEASITWNLDAALAAIDTIRQRGIAVTVTGFGSSYASLSYLDQLVVDAVKLHPGLLQSVDDTQVQHQSYVIEALVALFRPLGIAVVVDGIETAAQAQFVTQRRLGMAQGNYYAMPLTEAEFAAYRRNHQMQRAAQLAGKRPLPGAVGGVGATGA